MSKTPTFEILFQLKNTNLPTQKTRIQASDGYVARKIFEQQNPGARIVGEPRRLWGDER